MNKVTRVSARSDGRVIVYRATVEYLNEHCGFATVIDGEHVQYTASPSSIKRLARAVTTVIKYDAPKHVKAAKVRVLETDEVGYMLYVDYQQL